MNRNFNVLFIGLGSIGQRHLRNIKKLLSSKVNFFAYRKTRHVPLLNNRGDKINGKIEKKYNVSLVDNLNSINQSNTDIVFITNPSSHHISSVLKLKNLKNAYIFIEKPIDSSLKNYSKFSQFIKKNNINVFIGYNVRFHPGYIKLKKILSNRSVFKNIHYTIFKCGKNLEDYHNYEDYRISYAARNKLGGGICLTGVHELDMMLNLFGNAKLLKSHADKISNLKIDVEDFSLSFYKHNFFKRKVLSLIVLDFIQRSEERYIKIIGDKGEIFLDLVNYYLKISKKNKTKVFKFNKNKNLMYLDELKVFLKFFKKRKKITKEYNEINAFKSLKLAIQIKKNFS